MDMIDRPLGTYLNPELLDVLEPTFKKNMDLKMGVKIEGFNGNEKVESVKTDQGDVPADLVVVSAGVTPNTDWLKGTVDLDQRGWIKTDPYLRTNVKDVYAIGDAILPLSIPVGKPMPIALATTARREWLIISLKISQIALSRVLSVLQLLASLTITSLLRD